MSKLLSFFSGNAAVVGGGVVTAGVAAVGIYSSGVLQKPVTPEHVEPAALVQPVEPVVEPAAVKPVVEVPEPQAEADPAPTPEPEIVVVLPRFDVVRVETDGTTLIAGASAPDARIVILMDGVEVGEGKADGSGKFVAFLTVVASKKPRVLTLLHRRPEGDWVSEASVILAPSVRMLADASPASLQEPGIEIAMADPETAPKPVAMTADGKPESPASPTQAEAPTQVATQDAVAPEIVQSDQSAAAQPETAPVADTEPAVAEAPATQAVEEPVAEQAEEPAQVAVQDQSAEPAVAAEPVVAAEQPSPTVLLADKSGVRVLQAPVEAGAGPEVMSVVALDAITYSDEGEVELSGRGRGASFVRVYLDNSPITTSRISADGNWRTELPNIDTGVYTLRVDEVNQEGAVVSRVETPFKREDQETLASGVEVSLDQPVKVITVQPGSTLWAIARETYGEGEMYVRVFEANRDRIRDADLIYPGQVFEIPGQ